LTYSAKQFKKKNCMQGIVKKSKPAGRETVWVYRGRPEAKKRKRDKVVARGGNTHVGTL